MHKDFNDFCNNFDIVENAMQMRTLVRWNGRDLREKENLSEHTHLVIACAVKIYDDLVAKKPEFANIIEFEKLIRHCLHHDALELLRGDILSVTKDAIPKLREYTDKEELEFMDTFCGTCNSVTSKLVMLADLMACYKFIEYELRYPSNNFAINVYKDVKGKFDKAYVEFSAEYNIANDKTDSIDIDFSKGYEDDAGVDVILKEDVIFMPMSTCTYGLHVTLTPKCNEMGILCSRTSAAAKGLIVAMCPIDPNYTGKITAIVHNVSNDIVTYKKGESFCQIVTLPFITANVDGKMIVKKKGKRSSGKLGSTNM